MTEKYESLVQRQDFGDQARNSMAGPSTAAHQVGTLAREAGRPPLQIPSGIASSQDRKIEADAPA